MKDNVFQNLQKMGFRRVLGMENWIRWIDAKKTGNQVKVGMWHSLAPAGNVVAEMSEGLLRIILS